MKSTGAIILQENSDFMLIQGYEFIKL